MTKNVRKSGMPLFSWWSEEVTAETLVFWRLKSQGLGVRKAPAQVVLLRSFVLCSDNGVVRLINGGAASKPQPGRFFENQARLVNIFKVVVACQMSCVSTRCCQALFVSGNVTLRNTNWTKTSHSLIDKFLAPKSYGSETLFAEQFGDANVSGEQETIRVDRILNLSSAPSRQGFPPAASNMPSEQGMLLVY